MKKPKKKIENPTPKMLIRPNSPLERIFDLAVKRMDAVPHDDMRAPEKRRGATRRVR